MTHQRSSNPIGIFDSGVGGLTVANAIHEQLPDEHLIYFGDTAHLPYGDKSRDAIRQYALTICDYLLSQSCKAIVVACNSAATAAFHELRSFLNGKAIFVEVVRPLVKAAAKYQPENVGLIATKATVDSKEYEIQLKKILPDTNVHSMATPLLVPMIEEGFVDDEVSRTILEEYLEHSDFSSLDMLLLACTHYPLIKPIIQEYLQGVRILDSAEVTAAELSDKLKSAELLNPTPGKKDNAFYVSDFTETFEVNAQLFFGKNVSLKEARIWD
ncbi:MAG: glutamate racemase [Saprospiraceae bacterium]|nr:glutamate racemase [Saprospiraceae bacterium]